MKELLIDLTFLDAAQLAKLYHFIRNANQESLRQPFVCGEAADVLDALIALVGKEDARAEIIGCPDRKLTLDHIADIFTFA